MTALTTRRVEHHMSTAITLAGRGVDDGAADAFFARIAELEDVLSRFRPASDVSRFARGEATLDSVDPAVRLVVAGCEALRATTGGDFEHEPRRRSGDERDPVLDVNAYAKGWIVDEAAEVLRMSAEEFFVNAGGDIVTSARPGGAAWTVGIQDPADRDAVVARLAVRSGAVATSGAYERGAHLRGRNTAELISVTVTGPDLAVADGLATAAFVSGESPPTWWRDVDPRYGLLTMSATRRLRWIAPRSGDSVDLLP